MLEQFDKIAALSIAGDQSHILTLLATFGKLVEGGHDILALALAWVVARNAVLHQQGSHILHEAHRLGGRCGGRFGSLSFFGILSLG